MNYSDRCPHCGHKTTAYSLPLNEGLVRAFLAFADARLKREYEDHNEDEQRMRLAEAGGLGDDE